MNDANYEPKHSALDALNENKPMLSNKTYDQLKKFVTLGLPAFGTLYVTLASLWTLPNPEAVAGSCLALATFFGIILNLAGRSYEKSDDMYDGVINVQTDPETGLIRAPLILKNYENPAGIVAQSEARFKIIST